MSQKNIMSQSKIVLQKRKSESLLKYNLNKQFIDRIFTGLEMKVHKIILKKKTKQLMEHKPVVKKNNCLPNILSRQAQNNHIIRMRKFYLSKSMAEIKTCDTGIKFKTPYNVPSRYRNLTPSPCLRIAANSSLRFNNNSVRNDFSNNSFKRNASQNVITSRTKNTSVNFSYPSNSQSSAKESFERRKPVSSVCFIKSKNIVQEMHSDVDENEISKTSMSFPSGSKNDVFSDIDNVNANVEKLIHKINITEHMETLIKRTEELYTSMEEILFRMNHGEYEPVIKASKQMPDKPKKSIKNYMLTQNGSDLSVSDTDMEITEMEYLPTVEESDQQEDEYIQEKYVYSDLESSDENEEEDSDTPTETYTYDHEDDGRNTSIRLLNMQTNVPRNIALSMNNDLIYRTPGTLNNGNCSNAYETRPAENVTINQESVEPTCNFKPQARIKGLSKFMANNPHFSNQNYYLDTPETSNGFTTFTPIIESFQPTEKDNLAGYSMKPNNVYYASQSSNRDYLKSNLVNTNMQKSFMDSRETNENIKYAPTNVFVPQSSNGYIVKPYPITENKQSVRYWIGNPSLPTERISRETANKTLMDIREFVNSLSPEIKTANMNLSIHSMNSNGRDEYISDVSNPQLTNNNKGDPSGLCKSNIVAYDEQKN